ncbi:MAG: AMP-binding protein [Ideonella sp. WA131b]|nr:AMP-binding protein [Ideonella sp. WA131b]
MKSPSSPSPEALFDHVGHAIWLHGRSTPARPCAQRGSQSMSYAELSAQSGSVASALSATGLSRGGRVGVLMGNELSFLPLMVGIWLAGGVVVPFSTMLPADALGRLIEDADLHAIVCSDELRDPLHGALATLASTTAARVLAVDDLTRPREDLGAFSPSALEPGDACSLLYSSGTTGLPKGIAHSHHGRLMFALGMAAELSISRWSRVLLTTPMYSNGAWLMILPTLLMGGTLHVMPVFTVDGFLSTCKTARITHTFVVPLQCAVVLGSPQFAKDHLESMEGLVCGGAALAKGIKQRWLEVVGPAFVELYGMTEGFGTLVRPAREEQPLECGVGSPMAGTELRIIDSSDQEVPSGQVGEIVGRSAVLLTGYFRKPDLDAACVWCDRDGLRFFRSGDIGYLDRDLNLHIVDRKKDMIISGGFNVYPSDIEAVLMTHPDVREAAVIGVPDEKWGETPLALVIPKPGAEVDAQTLRAWCNDRVSKIQRLASLEFVKEFPRNALGKVLKRALREQWSGLAPPVRQG